MRFLAINTQKSEASDQNIQKTRFSRYKSLKHQFSRQEHPKTRGRAKKSQKNPKDVSSGQKPSKNTIFSKKNSKICFWHGTIKKHTFECVSWPKKVKKQVLDKEHSRNAYSGKTHSDKCLFRQKHKNVLSGQKD